MSVHAVLVREAVEMQGAGLSSANTTVEGRVVIRFAQEIPDLGNISSMKQTPSIPTFGLRELDCILLSSQPQCLGVCVLFWAVDQRMCSVSPADNASTWSNTALQYLGIGLLHLSHQWFWPVRAGPLFVLVAGMET